MNNRKSQQTLLESYLITGDPYSNLGLEFDCSLKEITKKFNELNKYLQDNGANDAELLRVGNAYNILSNEQLRDLYDNVYYQQIQKKKINDEAKDIFKELLYYNISSPFTIISKIIQGKKSINATNILTLLKNYNIITLYSKCAVFSVLVYPVELARQYIVQSTIERLLCNGKALNTNTKESVLVYKNNRNRIIAIGLDLISRTLVTFPSHLILDCIALAPPSLSIYQIIKNVVLRIESNTTTAIESNKFQYQLLYYGLLSQLSLLALGKAARVGVRYFSNWVYKKHISKPNDQVFYYLNKVLSSSVGRALLISIITNPLEVVRLQYPYILASAHQNQSPAIALPLNPISMAVSLYKFNSTKNTNGLSKFYDGFLPFFISKIFIEKALKHNVFEYESFNYFNLY